MRKFLAVLAVLVLLAAAAVAVGLGWAWNKVHGPYKGYPEAQKRILVENGQSATAILDRLAEEGVIRDPLLARLFLVHRLENPPLQAGEYSFSKPLSTPEILDILIRGDVILHDVTLVEGMTLEETAEHLAAAGFGDESAFLAAMRSPMPIHDWDPEANDLEGYLFPDTYSFARTANEEQIVGKLVATFRARYETHVLPLLNEAQKAAGPRDVVTLASIVEKEAQLAEERPTIAGVYANRLERGIALYADPTVIFALKKLGRWDGNLRRPDLALDSPYNTYRYPDLPPGPICSPGQASLVAAGRPADVPYIYFVSRNDGSHVFARTLAEHNRNVEIWQKRYWRERWAAEGR